MDMLPPAVAKLVADTSEFVSGTRASINSLKDFSATVRKAGAAAEQSGQQAEAASIRAQKAYLAQADAARKAATAQVQASDAARKLAAGEMDAARAGRADADAQYAAQKATLAARDAALADQKAQTAAARATRDSAAAAEESKGKTAAMTSSVTKAGPLAGLALAGIGVESVKMASDFQTSTTKLATQAGVVQSKVKGISKDILAMSGSVGQTPLELSNSFYHFASVGMDTAHAMKATKAAADLAAIGNSNLEDTSNALAGTWRSGIKGYSDFNDIAAIANKTVGLGNMRMSDFVNAIGTGALPAFKSAGLSIQDFGGALALSTDNSMNAQTAAHLLSTTVSLMASPTAKATGALKQIGMTSNQLADDMRSKGLTGALDDLHNHLKGMSADKQNNIINAVFGGARTSSMAKLLLSQTDALKNKVGQYGTVQQRQKTLTEALAVTHKNLSYQVKDLHAKFDVLMIGLGQKLIPIIEKVINWMTKHKTLSLVLAGIVGTLLVSAFLAWAGSVLAATWPILAVVGAITGLVLGVMYLWKHWNEVWNWIWHHKAFAALILIFSTILTGGLLPLILGVIAVAKHWKKIWEDMKGVTLAVWHAISGSLSSAWNWISNLAKKIWNGIVGFVKAAWKDMKAVFSTTMTILNYFLIPLRLVAALGILAFRGIVDVVKWAWKVVKPLFDAIGNAVLAVVGGAIKLLKSWWSDVWTGIHVILRAIWSVIKPIFDAIGTGIHDLGGPIGKLRDFWSDAWGKMKSIVSTIWDDLKPIFNAIEKAAGKVGGALSTIGHAAGDVGKAASWVNKALPFADGGLVSGPGTGTSDSIPAWLSDGEYVINARTVNALGVQALDSINAISRSGAPGKGSTERGVLAFAGGGHVARHTPKSPAVVLPHLVLAGIAGALKARQALTSKTSSNFAGMSGQIGKLTASNGLTDAAVLQAQRAAATIDAQRNAAWASVRRDQALARQIQSNPSATRAEKLAAGADVNRAVRDYDAVKALDLKARALSLSTFTALRDQRSHEWVAPPPATWGHGQSWNGMQHTTVVRIDGRNVFQAVQRQALQNTRRNINNLLTPASK